MADSAVLDRATTTPPTPPKHSFRTDVQGLRAVAVGLVVAAHAGFGAVSGGFVGVDVFFVISGFLITGLLLNEAGRGRISFIKFYTRRALRILPAATLVIAATGLASLYILNHTRAKEVLVESVWASLFGANIKFSVDNTDYFNEAVVSPLQHYWSLAVEEQFYLVWPAVLAFVIFGLPRLVARFRPGPDPAGQAVEGGEPTGPAPLPRGRIALILGVVGIASLVLSIRQTDSDPTGAYFSTLTRTWELVVGALLAVGLPLVQRSPELVRTALTWLGLAGIAVAAFTFTEATPFPGSAALIPVLASAAVLAGGVGAPKWGANRLLGLQPFRFIGDISYSLYLWHWPLLILGAAWTGKDLTRTQAVWLVLAALVLSALSYYLVENPVRKSRRIWGTRRWTPMLIWPVAVGSVVALALIGSNLAPRVPSGPAISADQAAGPAEVEASVLAARAGAGIPSNLSPALELIEADETNIGACSGYQKVSNEICQFGDPAGANKVVLFGNSHATAWVPGLSEVAKEQGWQFFPVVKEACTYPDYAGNETLCAAWFTWALQEIEKLRPDVIVVNAYSASNKDWLKGMTTVIEKLKPLGTRVVMLSDPPGVRRPPADCLQPRTAVLRSCFWKLYPTEKNATEKQALLAGELGVQFVDVTPWFCWKGACPTVIGNRVAYADIGHVTETYSRHLAPLLGTALELE